MSPIMEYDDEMGDSNGESPRGAIENPWETYSEVYEVVCKLIGRIRLRDLTCIVVFAALKKCKGNRKRAALGLGISEKTIYNYIERFGLRQKMDLRPKSEKTELDK